MPELDSDNKWVIRRSEVQDYLRCPEKWRLRWHLNRMLPPPEDPTKNALWLGTQWHSVLEYGLGAVVGCGQMDPAELIVRAHAAAEVKLHEIRAEWPTLPKWFSSVTLTAWAAAMLQANFLAEVVAVEEQYRRPMPFWPNLWPGLCFVQTIDGLGRDQWGNLWVLEHKTTSSSVRSDELSAGYTTDGQLTAGVWVVRENGYDVKGAVLDATRKSDAAKPTAPLAGVSIQARPEAATQLYYEELEETLALMAAHSEPRPLPTRRTWAPFQGRGCQCDFEPVCAAVLYGDDHKAILDRYIRRESQL